MLRIRKDCGIFAIAFTLHAALGHCVGEITDQDKMRNNLLECFKARNKKGEKSKEL